MNPFRWRKMTWVLWIWVAIIIAWVAAGVNQANCEDEEFTSACEAGTGIGVGLVILFGFLGFFVLGFIWLVTRPRRHCPACGRDVKKGQTACKKCGFDLAAAARGYTAPMSGSALPPPPPP